MRNKLRAPALLLFIVVVLGYLANGRVNGAGDTLPARYLPWTLLRQQSFDLGGFPFLYGEQAQQIFPLLEGIPYYLRYSSGRYVSAYSPGPAILALPVYAVPVLAGVPAESTWAPALEKLSAVLITGSSVIFLFWALRRLVALRWAFAIALVYAFGTSSLSVSSQALWEHGSSQFCLALALYFIVRGLSEEAYLAYAGLAMSAAVVMRATNLLLVLPVAAWILVSRRVAARFILFALPPAVGLMLYNVAYFHSVTGGSNTTIAPPLAFFTQIPLLEGVTGLLISPARGLFIYSPVLVFSLLGIIAIWRGGPPLFRALTLGPPLLLLVVGKWFRWWGGFSYGPRLLADATPILCFCLYPLVDYLDRRRLVRGLFVILAVFSTGAHALGLVFYDGRWDALAGTDRRNFVPWSWSDNPLAFYGRSAASRLREYLPAWSSRPTSADAPGLLAASFATGAIPSELFIRESIVVPVTARNIGTAAWLAAGSGGKGAVGLGWRWYSKDREISAGREPLAFDIGPGQAARFVPRIESPSVAGEYTLIIDLVSEGVSWFAGQGRDPIRVAVRVLPLDISRFLSPVGGESHALGATIATNAASYRIPEPLHLTVHLKNPRRPRQIEAYLVLQGPAGAVFLYDGVRISPMANARWSPWIKELPLPAELTGRFTVALSGLAPGRYAWHVVLTEPGTLHALVTASTTFRIES